MFENIENRYCIATKRLKGLKMLLVVFLILFYFILFQAKITINMVTYDVRR